eukprot:m.165861 g.165861  ORF g.165861 m.165861 type:complete len:56 (+) comp53127_c0_seq9:216-383(+)
MEFGFRVFFFFFDMFSFSAFFRLRISNCPRLPFAQIALSSVSANFFSLFGVFPPF